MTLKQCILTANDCYIEDEKIMDGKPVGIVVHSTGAPNTALKRYVQPLKTSADYNDIITDIGLNYYGNHWNQPRIYHYTDGTKTVGVRDYAKTLQWTEYAACVHAFIGTNVKGEIETYQTLPLDICCWGVGPGYKGSYNYNPQAHLQFEICEDDLTNKEYFEAAMKEAQELCASWCKQFNIPVSAICSHKEANMRGYGIAHGDPDHWLAKFGKNMHDFRNGVQAILDEAEVPQTTTMYRVQVGSFRTKEYAYNLLADLQSKGYNGYVTPVELPIK